MLHIGGLQKFSLIDYPGKVAAVIFFQGCDFRCPFCHNPELVLPDKFLKAVPEQEVLEFLKKRQGQLQGVVITGGEPTIQKDLGVFLASIKELGYCIKLDTNGYTPDVLKTLIADNLIDYVAMDIKTSLSQYARATGITVDTSRVQQSVRVIIESGLDYHFRTTVVPGFVSDQDLEQIAQLLSDACAYQLQAFSTKAPILDPTLQEIQAYTDEEFQTFQQRWEKKM